MEVKETEETHELASVLSLLMGLTLWCSQGSGAVWERAEVGLPAELKVAERVLSLPSDFHPLMSCLLWSLSDVVHLAALPKIPSLCWRS